MPLVQGKGTILEYAGYGYGTIAMECVDCDGTGWRGLRFATAPYDNGHAEWDGLRGLTLDERHFGTWRE